LDLLNHPRGAVVLSGSEMTNLEYALALATKGFKVFPYWGMKNGECTCRNPRCMSPGKHPRFTGFPAIATTNQNHVRKWWLENSELGIGIYPESLLIIDVDGPAGQESLKRLQQIHEELPTTYRVNSGNSEPHHYQLYYRCPNGLRVKNGPLSKRLPGYDCIDIKSGGGGQIAAPGNLHRSGRRYSWCHEHGLGEPRTREDISEAPSWLTEALGLIREGWRPPKKPRPRKAKGKAPVDTYHEPGSDGEILHAMADRFPILKPDTRRGIINSAVCWLLAVRKLAVPRSIFLLSQHLEIYRNNFNAALDDAVDDARRQVFSLEKKIRSGDFELSVDHNSLVAKQELIPILADYFDCLNGKNSWLEEKGGGEDRDQGRRRTPHAFSVRVPSSYHRLTNPEQKFIYCLLLYYQYQSFLFQQGDEFRFVESQIVAVMKIRFGREIGRTKFAELKNKFIGGRKLRGGERSPVRELFRCVSPAEKRGQASVYVPIDVPKLAQGSSHSTESQTKNGNYYSREQYGASPKSLRTDIARLTTQSL
jgi:hypothetical protein